MRTIISSNIKIIDPSWDVVCWCEEHLVVTNPLYEQMIRLGKEETIRWKHIPPKLMLYVKKAGMLIVPFGCLYGLWPLISEACML